MDFDRRATRVVSFDRQLFVVYVKPIKCCSSNVPIRRKIQKTAKIVHLKETGKTGYLRTAPTIRNRFEQMSTRLKGNIVCHKRTKFHLNRFRFGATVTLNVKLVGAKIDPGRRT